MSKYALTLSYCAAMGTAYAAHGIPLTRLLDELERDGYSRTGLTAQRMTLYYRRQQGRG